MNRSTRNRSTRRQIKDTLFFLAIIALGIGLTFLIVHLVKKSSDEPINYYVGNQPSTKEEIKEKFASMLDSRDLYTTDESSYYKSTTISPNREIKDSENTGMTKDPVQMELTKQNYINAKDNATIKMYMNKTDPYSYEYAISNVVVQPKM